MRPDFLGSDKGRGDILASSNSSRQHSKGYRIELLRVYDATGRTGDEYRVLVDRLWPRGISKADADIDEWAKEIAPSTELRKWYGHDPARFEEFSRRYRDELSTDIATGELSRLVEISRRRSLVILTATRELDISGAAVLYEVLRSLNAGYRRL
ncbi:MAG: DUF488 family protein [Actinobacteria bacterium]|jgi:uncharacterized protein YeaO (DUF488 family)|nr:DUF488 family protein [Actinomycetota bacterium]MCL5885427.1 DUF488 family protein [Actinomycetota bacterium]